MDLLSPRCAVLFDVGTFDFAPCISHMAMSYPLASVISADPPVI